MRNVIACGSLSRPRSFFLSFVFLSVLLSLFLTQTAAWAQKAAAPPKYDVQSEAKVKGTIEEVKPPANGNPNDAVHLTLKTTSDPVDVYLCPKSFLDDMGLSFTKGDEVEITGSKVKMNGADVTLTRELVKGNDTVSLRDAKGNPVWDWRH